MLKIRYLFAAAVGLLSLTPIVAGASGKTWSLETYQQLEGGWVVQYVPEQNQCVLGRPYEDKTYLQIFAAPELGWSIRLLNGKWTTIRADQTYNVILDMDGGANRWRSKWLGVWNNAGEPGVMITNLSRDFVLSFMKRTNVNMYNGQTEKWITGFQLDGSYAGMEALFGCIQEKGKPYSIRPDGEQQQRQAPPNQGNWS